MSNPGGGSGGNWAMIRHSDLSALLAIAAWAAREHADSLPEALLVPAVEVLARYDVRLDVT